LFFVQLGDARQHAFDGDQVPNRAARDLSGKRAIAGVEAVAPPNLAQLVGDEAAAGQHAQHGLVSCVATGDAVGGMRSLFHGCCAPDRSRIGGAICRPLA
jgi:hypothetical protein